MCVIESIEDGQINQTEIMAAVWTRRCGGQGGESCRGPRTAPEIVGRDSRESAEWQEWQHEKARSGWECKVKAERHERQLAGEKDPPGWSRPHFLSSFFLPAFWPHLHLVWNAGQQQDESTRRSHRIRHLLSRVFQLPVRIQTARSSRRNGLCQSLSGRYCF